MQGLWRATAPVSLFCADSHVHAVGRRCLADPAFEGGEARAAGEAEGVAEFDGHAAGCPAGRWGDGRGRVGEALLDARWLDAAWPKMPCAPQSDLASPAPRVGSTENERSAR